MKSMREFYDDYWIYRQKIGKVHIKNGTWIPPRIYKALELIQLRDNLRIIDIGCGDGILAKIIKSRAKKVHIIGVDISAEALKIAEKYCDETKLINIDEYSFSQEWNESFNYVFLLEILEHVFNPKKILTEAKSLIKKDGAIIASFPNMAWWKYRIEMVKGHYPKESRFYSMTEHLQNFTLNSFGKLIEESGLKISKINPDYGEIPKIFKYIPWQITKRLLDRYPNLFGYQIIMLLKS